MSYTRKYIDNISKILFTNTKDIIPTFLTGGDNMATDIEKKERFKRVAGNRTNKIIEQIRLLGNCANRSNYEYSSEDVKKIFSALENELKETKKKYQKRDNSKKFEL